MAGETASRTLALDISLGEEYISAKDETGVEIRFKHGLKGERAEKPSDYLRIFSKLGNTTFRLRSFDNAVTHLFFPASALTALRRNLVDRLLAEKKKLYVRDLRRQENESYPYPFTRLDYRDNVANPLAESFYRDHGVTDLEPALEVQPRGKDAGREVMKSRHCIMRELGLCLKSQRLRLPLTLTTGQYSFTPLFDCARCEMALNLH